MDSPSSHAELAPDQRRDEYGQMMAENKQRTEEFIKQVEDVLTAE